MNRRWVAGAAAGALVGSLVAAGGNAAASAAETSTGQVGLTAARTAIGYHDIVDPIDHRAAGSGRGRAATQYSGFLAWVEVHDPTLNAGEASARTTHFLRCNPEFAAEPVAQPAETA